METKKKILNQFTGNKNLNTWKILFLFLVFFVLIPSAYGGNPYLIQGNGNPWLWSTSGAVTFHPDGGSLGLWNNSTAVANTLEAFNRWGPDISTSALTFSNAGAIPGDGDVNTVAEFTAIDPVCESFTPGNEAINPVIFDADGSLFSALGLPSAVIAFATPVCGNSLTGKITEAMTAINGKWYDGNPSNGELTEDEFKGTLVHEFGHWLNLDHSQVNGHYFLSDSDDARF